MEKKTCVMYDDWMTLVSSMTEQQAGEFIKSIAAYRLGTEYEASDPAVLLILPMVISRLDADAEKYAERCRKNAENGRRGGKQKQANATERKQTVAVDNHVSGNGYIDGLTGKANLVGTFQSDEMTAAMNTWIDARSQIGRYPYASITQALSMALSAEKKHGATKCIELINKAIAGGWKSIPWDELDGKTSKANTWNNTEVHKYDWETLEQSLLKAQGE